MEIQTVFYHILSILLFQFTSSQLENSNIPKEGQESGQVQNVSPLFLMDSTNFPIPEDSSIAHQKVDADIPKSRKILNTGTKLRKEDEDDNRGDINKFSEDILNNHKFRETKYKNDLSLSKESSDDQIQLMANRNRFFQNWGKINLEDYMIPFIMNKYLNQRYSKMTNPKLGLSSEELLPLNNYYQHSNFLNDDHNFRRGRKMQRKSNKNREVSKKVIERIHSLMLRSIDKEEDSFFDNSNYQDESFENKNKHPYSVMQIYDAMQRQKEIRSLNEKLIRRNKNELSSQNNNHYHPQYYSNETNASEANKKNDIKEILPSGQNLEPILVTISPGSIHFPKRLGNDGNPRGGGSNVKIRIDQHGVPSVIGRNSSDTKTSKKPCKGKLTTTTSSSIDDIKWDFTTVIHFTINKPDWDKKDLYRIDKM